MASREFNEQLKSGRDADIALAEQVTGWQLETDEAKITRLNEYCAQSTERRWWPNTEDKVRTRDSLIARAAINNNS